jgi:glycosyltransferase involved in cell wall biosynthesis
MRIAYVSPVGVLGGAENCLLSVMASVKQARPQAQLHLVASSDGPLLQSASELGVSVHLVPMPQCMTELGDSVLHRREGVAARARMALRLIAALPQTALYILKLRRALKAIAPDVVHSNGLKSHLLTAVAYGPRTRLFWHLHDFIGARPAMGRALRWASPRATGAIAISAAVARDAQHVLGGFPIAVVYNAIDVSHFTPGEGNGPRLDELAKLPTAAAGTLRIGLVATFARWKGHYLLLDAAAEFFRRWPTTPARFYVIGGPIYHTQGSQVSEHDLRRRADQLGLNSHVGFIGFQRDTRSIYRDLDIVVHTSTQPEPSGLTIVEAMACAKPVIVSQAGGAAELFTGGVDAIGVPPTDVKALAEAIHQLVSDADLRRRLSEQALQTAQARFGHERLGGEILDVYYRLK